MLLPTSAGAGVVELEEWVRWVGCGARVLGATAQLIGQLITGGFLLGTTVLSMYIVKDFLDPYKAQRQAAKKQQEDVSRRFKRTVQLDEYEVLLLTSIVTPEDIEETLDDVRGYDGIIRSIRSRVVEEMQHPLLFTGSLLRAPRGVLLYGPPGTGKTMIAKALAKNTNCTFINLTVSTILSKWLGDANRLTRAVFTLAEKFAPSIIFVDEAEALLGKRTARENEAMTQVKTEFMQLWEGFETRQSATHVMVIAATNRPAELDEAILRRFSLKYQIHLPKADSRLQIMRFYLRKHDQEMLERRGQRHAVDPQLLSDHGPGADGLREVAEQTEGWSGSDIRQLLEAACKLPNERALNDYLRRSAEAGTADDEEEEMRMPSTQDQLEVLRNVQPVSLMDLQHVLSLDEIAPANKRARAYSTDGR